MFSRNGNSRGVAIEGKERKKSASGPEQKAARKNKSDVLVVKPTLQEVVVKIRGTTPLLVHRFDEKVRKGMLDSAMGRPKEMREARDPEEEYRRAMHLLPDGTHGFPTVGFKLATVSACTSLQSKSMPKTLVKQAFHVIGDPKNCPLVRINGDPAMDSRPVRIGIGIAQERFRPRYDNWTATLRLIVNTHAISVDQVISLLSLAGFAVGIGELRPGKTGDSYGMFEIVGTD